MVEFDIELSQPWRERSTRTVLDDLCKEGRRNTPTVIGVDGRSGSGKSTVADALAAAHGQATVVRTDDVAWHHSFFNWDQLLIDHVLVPLRSRGLVSFRPQAWIERDRRGTIEIPATTTLVIVEGVGACRERLRCWYDATIWVHASDDVARHRVLARGTDTQQFVDEWMAQEDALLGEERPWAHADVYVSGTDSETGPREESATMITAPGPRMRRGSTN